MKQSSTNQHTPCKGSLEEKLCTNMQHRLCNPNENIDAGITYILVQQILQVHPWSIEQKINFIKEIPAFIKMYMFTSHGIGLRYMLEPEVTIKEYPLCTDFDMAIRANGIQIYVSNTEEKKDKYFDRNKVFKSVALEDLHESIIDEIFEDTIKYFIFFKSRDTFQKVKTDG